MNVRRTLAVLLLLAAPLAVRAEEPTLDQAFLGKAMEFLSLQIQLGQLAEKKGGQEAVREFAKRMVESHTKARQDLLDRAKESKHAILAGADKEKRQQIADLKAIEDASAFDRAYLRAVVEEHERVIERCRSFVEATKDDQLKKFAEDCLAKMKDHKDEAKKLLDKSK